MNCILSRVLNLFRCCCKKYREKVVSHDMIIDYNIKVRKDIPIKNKYKVFSNLDFHVVFYYLDQHKCEIIIRRLDKHEGWNNKIKILLYSNNQNNTEEIIILPNKENYLKKTLIVRTKLEAVDLNYKQDIPKVIVQTAETNKMSLLKYNSVMTFLELNPEYEYKFFNDKMRRQFVKEHFDNEILESYDQIVPKAFKADLFRYCYLYIYGGCYFDCKQILRKSLRKIINKNKKLILVYENSWEKEKIYGYANGFMMATQSNIIFKNAVDMVNHNVKIKKYRPFLFNIPMGILSNGRPDLELSGPRLLRSLDKNIDCDYKLVVGGIIDKNKKFIIKKEYNGYYQEYSGFHFVELWKRKEVYYQNKFLFGDYIIYVYPNKYKDIFTFNVNISEINIYIEVKRIDKNKGWNQNLKILLINNINNDSQDINVGNSNHNSKNFTVKI
jgi:mannosyltransferase OCH1-like enzyme